jgi:hypothetical protein
MNDPYQTGFASTRQKIIDGAKQLDKRLGEVRHVQQEAQTRARKAEDSRGEFGKAYATLATKTAAACNEILQTRRHDEWSLAFSYLANYLLSQIGQARLSGNERVFSATLFNLSRLSSEMVRGFPESALALDAWQRSINALGSGNEPEADAKPHPHADALSRVVLMLRDTGPKIGLREIYAASEGGLHVIRPA